MSMWLIRASNGSAPASWSIVRANAREQALALLFGNDVPNETQVEVTELSNAADRREGFVDGVKTALRIIEHWRAREDEWLANAKNGDIAPRGDPVAILEDAQSRAAVLRGAAADIRDLLTSNKATEIEPAILWEHEQEPKSGRDL